MKKILGLTIAAILIIGLVGVGTWAYFQDTETSTNNSLTAGSLDLQVDGGNSAVTTFSAANIMPGDNDSGSTSLTNGGSVNGMLSLETSAVTNTEGTGEFADGGEGELGAAVNIAIYIDVNGNGAFDVGDIGLNNTDDLTYSGTSDLDLIYQSIDSFGGKSWSDIETLAAEATDDFHVEWDFPETDTDQSNCQGDSVSIDFTFTLTQQ